MLLLMDVSKVLIYFPDKVLRGAITMMTLRFDMMSKMYRGMSGRNSRHTNWSQIMIVWHLMWLSIILAADPASNIFSELVNLQRKEWAMLTRIQEALQLWQNCVQSHKYVDLFCQCSDNFIQNFPPSQTVWLFQSLPHNEIQRICKTYISAYSVQFSCSPSHIILRLFIALALRLVQQTFHILNILLVNLKISNPTLNLDIPGSANNGRKM